MLRKLMKYEFRASSWLLPVCLLAIVLLYGAGWAAKAIGISQLTATFSAGLVIVGAAAVIVALVTIVTRFAKGLFGSEGYLTQTLPVGKGTLILAKAITGFVLLVASMVMMAASIFGMLHILDMNEAIAEFNRQVGGMMGSLGALIVVMLLIELLLAIAEIYFAITLANTRPFLSNSVLFGVLFYFGTQTVMSLVGGAAVLLLPFGVRFGTEGTAFVMDSMLKSLLAVGNTNDLAALNNMTIGLGSLIVDVAGIVGLLLLTRWLMTRKTSVK